MIEIKAMVDADPYDLTKDVEDLGDILRILGKFSQRQKDNFFKREDGTRIYLDALWRCEKVVREVAEQGREQ
jgi:hypothetical protein